ncbi:MAG TPA: hypothetical protein VGB65_04365 [Allosphingosinicella sp.]
MRMRLISVLALATLCAAPAVAAGPSPPVFWAGCAGAFVVKAERSGAAANNPYSPMARRALLQARLAANPQKLSPKQIGGVAVSAAVSFRNQLRRNPGRAADFDKAVKLCSNSLAKLPK